MGCNLAKEPVPEVKQVRRRLSLGDIDIAPTGEREETEVKEEDRALMMQLTQSQILDFVKTNEMSGRKYSIGSETDTQGKLAKAFSDKSVKLEGTDFNAGAEGLGFACKKGLKPESPNQDSFFVMKVEDKYSLYGVFDGHGRKGHDVSNFVKDNLPKILFSQDNLETKADEVLKKTFKKTQYLIEKATQMKTLDATRSGTTCSVVLHMHEQNKLYIAHVGDSRVVLGKQVSDKNKGISWKAVDLTIDHKPDLPEERKRIEKAGGMVLFDGGWNHRVYARGKKDQRGKRYPGLNMSRAMGDLSGFYDAGISADPEVNSLTLACSEPSVASVEIDPAVDKFVMLCSDGVWEFMSSQDAVQTVGKHSQKDVTQAAETVTGIAWDKWIKELDGQVVDDITCVIAYLSPEKAAPQ